MAMRFRYAWWYAHLRLGNIKLSRSVNFGLNSVYFRWALLGARTRHGCALLGRKKEKFAKIDQVTSRGPTPVAKDQNRIGRMRGAHLLQLQLTLEV